MNKEIQKEVLGRLFFKKGLYLITDFNDKSVIKGLCVLLESSAQRNSIKVNISGEFEPNAIQELNSNDMTFNAEVELKDVLVKLKENGQYSIWASDIIFGKEKGGEY